MSRRPPEPTARDLAAWRRLAREAHACVRRPEEPVGELERVARQAHGAVVIGILDRANPCVRLLNAVHRFTEAPAHRRAALALELGLAELAGLVSARAAPRTAFASRRRADLDD